jgi:MIP family channel proteins
MKVAKIKHQLVREFLAETLGTFILVLFGNGAIAQFKGQASPFIHVAFGYGLALTLGILISGGVSGGHLNPAVTLAMATLKKCKWIQVPVYWAAQYLGAFLASAVLFGTYADWINQQGKDVKSAGIFASYPGDFGPSTISLILDQFLGTALLLIIILSVTDGRNMKVTSSLVPLYIGLGLTAIHLSFALNAGCAINPARDFSPRLFTLIAGFGNETFKSADYFFWIPWLVPHFGGIFGAIVYYFMVEHHHNDVD